MNESKKPIAIIAVGLPACGKTTLYNALNEKFDLVHLSSDKFIEEYAESVGKTYNQVFQERIKLASKQYNQMLNDSIANKKSFYVDRTNLSVKSREIIISKLPKDYHVFCVNFFDIDSMTIFKRNKERESFGRSLPTYAISEMADRFYPPELEEGFDLIVHVD